MYQSTTPPGSLTVIREAFPTDVHPQHFVSPSTLTTDNSPTLPSACAFASAPGPDDNTAHTKVLPAIPLSVPRPLLAACVRHSLESHLSSQSSSRQRVLGGSCTSLCRTAFSPCRLCVSVPCPIGRLRDCLVLPGTEEPRNQGLQGVHPFLHYEQILIFDYPIRANHVLLASVPVSTLSAAPEVLV